jgi:hypothetical protein
MPECKKNGKNYKRCAEPLAKKDEGCSAVCWYRVSNIFLCLW